MAKGVANNGLIVALKQGMINLLQLLTSWFSKKALLPNPNTKVPKIRRCANLAEASGQANSLAQRSGKDYSILHRGATDVIIVHTKDAPTFMADGYLVAFGK